MKLTKSNAKKILTYKPDPEDERDLIFSSSVDCNIDEEICTAPSQIGHKNKMTSVKDQGNLGSCVGFAVTAMKEWQETIEHEKEVLQGKKYARKDLEYDLSESWVYWYSKKIDPWPNEEGTSIRFAMKVLQKLGTPSEAGWKYDDQVKGEPKSWAHLVSRWARIGSYWRVQSLKELKVALLDAPVIIGIPCFEEMFSPVRGSGFVDYPANPNAMYGGHAVCVTGFDDNYRSRGGVIEFKNSWGTNWGKRGYGYLPYKYIEDFLWDAWTCKDVSMTKKMLKETKKLL